MKKTLFALGVIYSICMTAQNALSEQDNKFIKEIADGSLLEVRLGELAQTHASSSEVKSLGSVMVTDHSKANDELKKLATRKNVPLASGLSEKSQKYYDALSKKQGKDFDKAYSKCMVKAHKKTICKFKKEVKKGSDADVKSWASNTIPTLEHHEQMSETTCKDVKK